MRIQFIYTLTVIGLLLFASCKTGKPGTTSSSAAATHGTKKTLTEREQLEYDFKFYTASKEQILGNLEVASSLFMECMKKDPSQPAPMYELAKNYNYAGDKDKALELSAKAASLDPSNVWYQMLYADCLFAKKQYAQTAEVYQHIIKLNPDKIETYFELAETYLYAGKPMDAIKVYDRIEEKIGVNDEGNVQKVKIYSQLKNTDKAIKELEKLIKTNPKEPKYYGMMGEIYQAAGQKEKALQTYNELLKVDPENPYVHLSLAQNYMDKKEEDNALDEYKLAFKNTRLDIDTKMKVLISFYSLSEKKPALKEKSLDLCKILIDVHPDEAKSYSMYGDFLLRDKKLSEARDAFRMANARDKTRYVIWNEVLFIDAELNDYDAMLFDSKQVIDLFPAQPSGYLFNGVASIQKKDYAHAVDVLKEGKEFVIENNPLLTQFYASLGDALHQLKDNKASDEAYEKSLELDPKNADVLNNYAYYLSVRKENLKHAEEMSKKTVDMKPNSNSYLDTYGWILYQQGNYEEAKKWLGKALDNGARNNGIILEHYGDVLFKLGDQQKALEYWNDAKQKGGASELIEKKIADKKLYE